MRSSPPTPLTFVSTNHVILYERMRAGIRRCRRVPLSRSQVDRAAHHGRGRAPGRLLSASAANTGRLDEVVRLLPGRGGLKLILDALAHDRHAGRRAGTSAPRADVLRLQLFRRSRICRPPTSGMICFADQHLDTEVRKWTWARHRQGHLLADHERPRPTSGTTRSSTSGSNITANSIMAAIGLVSIKYVDEDKRAAPPDCGVVRRRARRLAADRARWRWAPGCEPLAASLSGARRSPRRRDGQPEPSEHFFPACTISPNKTASIPMYARSAAVPAGARREGERINLAADAPAFSSATMWRAHR